MAKKQAVAAHVDLARARARWCARQGLAPRIERASMTEIVSRTGWVRALGGIDVYLAVRARVPALAAADLDRAVADSVLRVVPAARGCMYLVPGDQVPLAFALAAALWRPRTEREVGKAGATWQEVETLADIAARALAAEPLTPFGLRSALPAGAVRSLGDAGKKIGLSSLLPVALRLLEFQGRVERRLEDGRLDSERYLWQLARDPVQHDDAFASATERDAALARHVLQIAGPITSKQLAAFTGLAQRDSNAALEAIGATPVAVDGLDDTAWLLPDELAALCHGPSSPPLVTLLPFEDNLLTIHGGPVVHVDAAHHHLPVSNWGGGKDNLTLGTARHISHRVVLSGDRIVGFWEYDASADRVVHALFEPLSGAAKDALAAECQTMAGFIRDQLGHARSFSLDTDAEVSQRAAFLLGHAGPASRPASAARLTDSKGQNSTQKTTRRTGGKKTVSRRGPPE